MVERISPEERYLRVQGILDSSSLDTEARDRLKENIATLYGLLVASRERETHDALTGLPNQRGLEEFLQTEINRMARLEHAQRSTKPIIYVLLDLNGLKFVNDNYGHEDGDSLVCKAAEYLKTAKRNSEIAGRLHGDEFVLIAPETNDKEARGMINRLKKTQNGFSLSIGNEVIPLSMAIGYALVTHSKEDLEKVRREADAMMKTDKQRMKQDPRYADLIRGNGIL